MKKINDVTFFQRGRDPLSSEARSKNMSLINQKDTKPELFLRSELHKRGLRFRKNVKTLPGSPDIVLPKYQTVIFVHGCFWHRHNCKRGQSIPEKNRDFWIAKFQKNIERDKSAYYKLALLGWMVVVVWECELDMKKNNINSLMQVLNVHLQDINNW